MCPCRLVLDMHEVDTSVVKCVELVVSASGSFVVRDTLEVDEFASGYVVDVPREDIVGTVGAGDAFCAGMLYAFINHMNMTDGMRLASCVAACNLASADSVSGAKNLDDVLELEKKYQRRAVL